MKSRNALTALLLLLSASAFGQISFPEVSSAPHEEVENALAGSHPSTLYAYSSRLFQEGQKDEAVFWFYAGQLRFRYLLAANPDLSPDGEPALMSSLNATLGQTINEWAGADPAAWARAMDRALEWDATHDNPGTPKADHQEALQQVRSGLAELRDSVMASANEIREQRKAAGLPVR